MNFMARILPICCLALFPLLGSCSYTITATEGVKVNSVQVQKIKLGRTTEMDLLNILGPASKKERLISGTEKLLYESTEIKSPTFIGGYKAKGLFDKEDEEVFEVTLRNGVVESYRFIKQ